MLVLTGTATCSESCRLDDGVRHCWGSTPQLCQLCKLSFIAGFYFFHQFFNVKILYFDKIPSSNELKLNLMVALSKRQKLLICIKFIITKSKFNVESSYKASQRSSLSPTHFLHLIFTFRL